MSTSVVVTGLGGGCEFEKVTAPTITMSVECNKAGLIQRRVRI